MRRLAAVFSSRRSDKSDAASNLSNSDCQSNTAPPKAPVKSRSSLFKSLSKATAVQPEQKQKKSPVVPPVFTAPDHAASSSSSSSGGPSTPNDDQESFRLQHVGKKNWLPLPFLHDKILPPTPAEDPSRPYLPRAFENDKDDDASSASHSAEELGFVPLPPTARLVSPSPPLSPVAYCRALAANALEPLFSPPPLLVVPNAPLFPRSSNSPRRLTRRSDSLLYRLHQTRLLRRLQVLQADRSLAAFSNRKTAPPKPASLVMDDIALCRGHVTAQSSSGLRRWAERPCFEDRVLVYLPSDRQHGGVRSERVYATAAVEALGLSEALEALAGLNDEEASTKDAGYAPSPSSNTPPLSMTPSTASLSSLPPSPSVYPATDAPFLAYGAKANPNSMQKPTPSPLRIASTEEIDLKPPTVKYFGSPSLPASLGRSTAPSSSSSSPAMLPSPHSAAPPKPAVRFVEADKDQEDTIPLDYVMRIKQARDQKAKFLAAERARRQTAPVRDTNTRPSLDTPQEMRADLRRVAEERRRLEEEKKRHEVERRKQEEERRKLDRERAAWERERKVIEEERKQKLYAEEIAEARRRREGVRQGSVPKTSEGNVAWSGDRERERERRGSEARSAFTRPRYDELSTSSRRQSEPASPYAHSSSSPRPNVPAGSSPGSSRPPSITSASVRDSSRPPSMYSTPPSSASAVDVRPRDVKSSRRASFMSEGSNLTAQHQQMMMQQAMPAVYPWGSPIPTMPMNMVPVPVPVQMMQMQMPMMPYMDMPLLPPTPPFMMQQYGQRGSGQRSHSSSPPRAYSPSSERQGTSGRASPQSTHRRTPSDELSKRPNGSTGRSQSYTAPYHQKQSSSSASLRSGNTRPPSSMSHSQTQALAQRPPAVTSRSQPASQNNYRQPPGGRQTMIR